MKKSRPLLWLILACALLCSAPCALPADTKSDVQKQFEAMAKESPYYNWGSPPSFKASKKDVLTLLKHPDPKVRVMAIEYLASLQDVRVLPAIAELLDDEEIVLINPKLQIQSNMVFVQKDMTVGQIAHNALAPYLNRGKYPIVVYPNGPGVDRISRHDFDEYWNTHKDRSYCASWFAVRAQQAINHSELIRAEIEKQVPQPERAWLGVWLNRNADYSPYSESDLLKLLKEIGPDAIMDTLKTKHIPGDDPDLNNNFAFKFESHFILENSDKLLRPKDSNTLISLNTSMYKSPWWFIGAAQLKPQISGKILCPAYKQFSDSSDLDDLNMALFRLGGKSQVPFLVDQFYGGSWYFIETILAVRKNSEQKVVAAILQDKRIDTFKWDYFTFSALAEATNLCANKIIVTPEQITQATGGLPDGKTQHPIPVLPENPILKRELLRKMRDSIPLWAEPKS